MDADGFVFIDQIKRRRGHHLSMPGVCHLGSTLASVMWRQETGRGGFFFYLYIFMHPWRSFLRIEELYAMVIHLFNDKSFRYTYRLIWQKFKTTLKVRHRLMVFSYNGADGCSLSKSPSQQRKRRPWPLHLRIPGFSAHRFSFSPNLLWMLILWCHFIYSVPC